MPDFLGRFQFASADIVHEEFDGEFVILNLTSGVYYALNNTASLLIVQLLAGVAFEELATLAGSAYSAEDTQRFLARLIELDLINATPKTSASPMPSELRESAKAWADPPIIEVYDDLADLIVVDPIHETEATVGWPTTPNAA